MNTIGNEINPGAQRWRIRLIGPVALMLGILLLSMSRLLSPEIVSATTVYSYIDDQGTPVLTDNLESIPERYRGKVQTTEQVQKEPPTHSAAIRLQQKMAALVSNTSARFSAFTPTIPGRTHYQSRVLAIGGIVAAICLIIRIFVRSQAVRFLSLWCLIMLGLTVPALLFTSQNAPLDLLRDQSGKIQEKQQEHLQRTP